MSAGSFDCPIKQARGCCCCRRSGLSYSHSEGWPSWQLLVIFILGSFLMRSAGVVVNDLADRPFDRHVARTRERPLASGELTPRHALVVLAILLTLAALLVLQLNPPDDSVKSHRPSACSPLSLCQTCCSPSAGHVGHRIWLGNDHGVDCLTGHDRQCRLAALCRHDLLGGRLRHHLCAARYRGRSPDWREVVGTVLSDPDLAGRGMRIRHDAASCSESPDRWRGSVGASMAYSVPSASGAASRSTKSERPSSLRAHSNCFSNTRGSAQRSSSGLLLGFCP